MKQLLIFSTLFVYSISFSQAAIGNIDPNNHAQLDVSATQKGVLIPRIALHSKTSPFPISSDPNGLPQSLLVFNTNNTVDLDIAYYYWNRMKWNKVIIDDNLETLSKSPWNKEGTTTSATLNTDNIYQKGKVGIGEPNMIPKAWLDVKGDALINGLTIGKGPGDILSNTAIGVSALVSNISGNENTATGYQALFNNTLGNSNVASGNQALFNNTSGSANVASGNQALYSNTTGINNTAIGYIALYKNTIGTENTATGSHALYSNTTGINNTATGVQALYSNISGNENTAAGYQALYKNRGSSNTAAGYVALYYNTTGNNNTATGNQALYKNTTGSNNTATGYQALYYNTTGDNNVAIGNNSGPSFYNLRNTIAIGYEATVATSNTIQLGNRAITDVYTSGNLHARAFFTTSDRRYKENIKTIPLGLDFINKVRPVEYIRKNNENKTKEWGVIAQELQQTIEDAGYQNAGIVQDDNTPDKYLSVRYTDLMAPMIKAIQELSKENEDLKKKNDQMQMKDDQLEVQINEIEKRVKRLMIKLE